MRMTLGSEEESMRLRSVLCPLFILGLLTTVAFHQRANAQQVETPSHQVIVKWREQISLAAGSSAASLALRDAEARVGVRATALRVTASGSEVLRLDRALSMQEMTSFVATLKESPQVEYAEENKLLYADMTPNDPRYSEQWHFFTFSAAGIRLPAAWDLATGSGITVAVIDTG